MLKESCERNVENEDERSESSWTRLKKKQVDKSIQAAKNQVSPRVNDSRSFMNFSLWASRVLASAT